MLICPFCRGEFEPDKPGVGHNSRRRSNPAHNRFHAVMARAFHHWPSNHRLKPYCKDDVRIYLQLRAGWGHQFATEDGQIFLMPRSIKFSEMDQASFSEMADRVYRILREETGLDHEQLLEEHIA